MKDFVERNPALPAKRSIKTYAYSGDKGSESSKKVENRLWLTTQQTG